MESLVQFLVLELGGYFKSSTGLVRPVKLSSSLPLNRQSHLCLLPAFAGKEVISTPVRTDICLIASSNAIESSKSLPHSSLAPPPGLMGQASRRPFAHYSRSRPRSTEPVESGVVIARCASSQPGAVRIAPFGRSSDRMGRPLKQSHLESLVQFLVLELGDILRALRVLSDQLSILVVFLLTDKATYVCYLHLQERR